MSTFHRLFSLIPFLIFLFLFLGTGFYFYLTGVEYAFYQISPTVAILPALIVGLLIGRGSFHKKMQALLKGMGNQDILTMCLIFLLAGAFGVVTKAIGCVDDIVHFTLSFLPPQALLPGLFILGAFISLAVGSSMAVVASLTPIALGFVQETGLPLALSIGTVIGGAMFGDNLSMISDTTIAAVTSQKADLLKKFKLNAFIASITGALVICLLFLHKAPALPLEHTPEYSVLKLLPYGVVLGLAMLRTNVFVILTAGLTMAGVVGVLDASEYTLHSFTKDVYEGFSSMNEIMVLSLLVGGMSGLMRDQGGLDVIVEKINALLRKRRHSKRLPELAISGLVSLTDICVANNTIAIILTGDMARHISQTHKIAPHRSACWLSIFSCVFQGILPYSAQILLACSIAHLSPLVVIQEVYYCYLLLGVTVLYIFFSNRQKKDAFDA